VTATRAYVKRPASAGKPRVEHKKSALDFSTAPRLSSSTSHARLTQHASAGSNGLRPEEVIPLDDHELHEF